MARTPFEIHRVDTLPTSGTNGDWYILKNGNRHEIYIVQPDGSLVFNKGITDSEQTKLTELPTLTEYTEDLLSKVDSESGKSLVDNSQIAKLTGLNTQAQQTAYVDQKVGQLAAGEKGSVSPSITAPTVDGIYRASSAGNYSNLGAGLTAKVGYNTFFERKAGVWTLYSETAAATTTKDVAIGNLGALSSEGAKENIVDKFILANKTSINIKEYYLNSIWGLNNGIITISNNCYRSGMYPITGGQNITIVDDSNNPVTGIRITYFNANKGYISNDNNISSNTSAVPANAAYFGFTAAVGTNTPGLTIYSLNAINKFKFQGIFNLSQIEESSLSSAANTIEIERINLNIVSVNSSLDLKKYETLYNSKRVINIASWQNLIDLSAAVQATPLIYKDSTIRLTAGILLNSSADLLGVTNIVFPENAVLDMNGFTLRSNGLNITLTSPFAFNDDGDNFTKYPKIIYDRTVTPRPIYYTSNELYTEPMLKGMWRVNDDKIYITDFHRGKRFNKAVSPFVNSKIIFDYNFSLSFGNQDADELGFYYGFNSNIELSCENNATVTFTDINTNITNNTYRVVGNNFKMLNFNLGALDGVDNYVNWYFRPARNYGIVKYEIGNSKIRANVSTDIREEFINNEFLGAVYNSTIKLKNTAASISALNSGICLSLLFNNGTSVRNNLLYGSFYGISINASTNCEVYNNDIEYSKWVGILLSGTVLNANSRAANPLFYKNSYHFIQQNRVFRPGEEGISLDSVGGRLNMCQLKSVVQETINFNGRTITVNNKISVEVLFPDTTSYTNYKNGAFLISLHKDRPMNYCEIKNVTLGNIVEGVQQYIFEGDFDSFNDVEIDDKYIIAKVAYKNLIEMNTIRDSWTALCIYGNAIANVFKNNTSYSTGIVSATWQIYIQSLKNNNGGLSRCYYMPSIDNVYDSNKIIDSVSTIYGGHAYIAMVDKHIDDADFIPLDPNITTYSLRGNKIINNDIKGELRAINTLDSTITNNRAGSFRYQNCKGLIANNPLPLDVN